jgi:hypothetical protein
MAASIVSVYSKPMIFFRKIPWRSYSMVVRGTMYRAPTPAKEDYKLRGKEG